MTPQQLQAEHELIDLWRAELLARMGRAQAMLETDGIRLELHEALIGEALYFIRICRGLRDLVPGSLADDQEEAA